MSGFGALCPLPLRLSSEGWSAAEFMRLAADTVAAARTVPFAWVRVTSSGTVEAYRGPSGTQPIAIVVMGTVVLAWPTAYVDALGRDRIVAIRHAVAGAPVTATDGNSVSLELASGTVTVAVYGSDRDSVQTEDYGATADKQDTVTEQVPYAWTAYQALQDARGSSYSKEHSGLVHVENLALARGHAARWRDAERLSCNSNPETATEKLGEWIEALGIARRTTDTDATIRAQCGARFRLFSGPRQQAVDAACAGLLGDMFVRSYRFYTENLAAPTPETYWPGVAPGVPPYDLGGGSWYSDRCKLLVEVTQPTSVTQSLFLDRTDRLTETLDRIMPAWAVFEWSVNTDTGFVLDFDELDFAGVAP